MYDFDWHPAKAASNLRKHGIDFNLAATVFEDPLASSVPDDDHSEFEDRLVTVGQSRSGQLLVVCHTLRETDDCTMVRIISARRAMPNERRDYESGE